MGQKICPLSFFNFYINKEAAQAGGCHLCVEESCAWWDETYQQCSLKSGFEAVSAIADSLSNDSLEKPAIKSTSPISDVLAKLRKKKENSVTEVKPQESIPPPPPSIAPIQAPSVTATVSPATVSPIVSTIQPEPDIRPNIPVSELPVVSINTSSKEDDLKL